MTPTDHLNALIRMVRTLETIVEQWPEITAQQLLGCAQQLPSMMSELPLPQLATARAVSRYIEQLVDGGALPPWCG